MQNVFPARELYNSNPCREMWDSEQLSQAGASCSQGSQNSSSDLFSQSRMSQLKGFSSFDVWSQQTNSQQVPEDEPVKYYMKYMTKPPLFSSESERQSQKKQQPQTTSYKELIEIQKRKTVERDDRDVLDSFISLLKDYTKEVKTAMDSFKDSIDSTLATKAEEVATAASQSADLIKKLKDDLLESFGCLRKDLKENEELKEVISKQNEKIFEKESQIKMLQAQLEDCRARELKSMEKHEKFMEREDKLLQKLDEISNKHVPLPSSQLSTARNVTYDQVSGSFQNCNEMCLPQGPPIMGYQPQLAWESAEVSRSTKLHHMHNQIQPVTPHPYVQNTTAQVLNANVQGASNHTQAKPALNHLLQPHSTQDDAVVPCMTLVQHQVNMGFASNQQNAVHPTAAIAPMRTLSGDGMQSRCQQQGNITESVDIESKGSAPRPQKEVVFVPDNDANPQETNKAQFTSPGVRVPSLTKATWPKQSPIAAVHPQIRVKRECEEEKTKASAPSCAKKVRKEDPFDIFVFELTSSPEEEGCDVLKSKPASLKVAPKTPVNKPPMTRSMTNTCVNGANKEKATKKTAESSNLISHGQQRNKRTTKGYLSKKFSSTKEDGLPGLPLEKGITAFKCKETDSRDGIAHGCNGTSTPNRPVKSRLENGIPRSKVAQSVFQKSKTSFKRNMIAAKRKLSFDASELFDGLEDDTNIQQITESIRKHAQRKRASKVL